MKDKRTFSILSVIFLLILKFIQVVHADHDGSDDPLDWLRESIPGEPSVDYPIFSEVQTTSFSCKDRVFGGYYADPEMQCQGYHVCLSSRFMPGIADRKMSFLCPNGTIFSQALFTCDWWFNVDCSEAEGLYAGNEVIGDPNARLGGGENTQSSQGQRQQSTQRGGNNNRQKPKNNKVTKRPTPRTQKPVTRTQRPSPRTQKPVSRKKTVPKKPQQRNTSRKQSNPNTGSQQQSNRPSRKKPTKTQPNQRRKQPSGRKVVQNTGGPKKRPQKPKKASIKPQNSPKVEVGVLPEYDDDDSKGVPDFKRTQGIGSSSVQGINNDIPVVSSADDYGSSAQRNVGEEKVKLSPIQNTQLNIQDENPTFEPQFDIVQYDATIPDGDDDYSGVPILLADPFSGFRTINTDPTGPRVKANRRTGPSSRPNFKVPPKELQLYSVPKLG